eukprot:2794356-Pleurochrysis_carterae.AAC.4
MEACSRAGWVEAVCERGNCWTVVVGWGVIRVNGSGILSGLCSKELSQQGRWRRGNAVGGNQTGSVSEAG